MRYRIKAIRPGSGISELAIEAANEADARSRAERNGVTVLSVTRAGKLLPSRRNPRFPLLFLSQEILSLLDSGIVLIDVLQTLAEKEARPLVRNVLNRLIERLREGWTFSDALAEHDLIFPHIYIASVRASERTGDLAETLRRYVNYQQQLDSLRSKMVSALIYPMLLIGVGGAVILFLMAYVIPSFSRIYEEIGGDLPLVSRFLLAWGNLLRDHWLSFLAAVCGLGIVSTALWRQPRTRSYLAEIVWRLPAIGDRLRIFQLARFYRTLGMLLRGGIAIVPALEIVADLLPAVWQRQMAMATRSVREGVPVSSAMDANGLSTRVALRMMRVGEHAGNMGEMMERIAAFHDAQIARETEVLTRLFGPVLMLLIGGLIGTIVVFMYLPIFQLAESVS